MKRSLTVTAFVWRFFIMNLRMLLQVGLVFKSPVTMRTLEGFFSGVRPHVSLQLRRKTEPGVTLVTFQAFWARVNDFVAIQIDLPGKTRVATGALIRPLAGVDALMTGQTRGGRETQSAFFALEIRLFGVALVMLRQISLVERRRWWNRTRIQRRRILKMVPTAATAATANLVARVTFHGYRLFLSLLLWLLLSWETTAVTQWKEEGGVLTSSVSREHGSSNALISFSFSGLSLSFPFFLYRVLSYVQSQCIKFDVSSLFIFIIGRMRHRERHGDTERQTQIWKEEKETLSGRVTNFFFFL